MTCKERRRLQAYNIRLAYGDIMDNPYFQHEFTAGSDPKLDKVQMYLKTSGYGLYWHITEMLYREKGKLPLSEIPYISKKYEVTEEFINQLINLPVGAGKTLFQKDDVYFWSDSVIKRLADIEKRSENARKNAHKRWHADTSKQRKNPKKNYKKFSEFDLVNLTEEQYSTLIKKYSEKEVLKAVEILNGWLLQGSKKAREYIGRPHYGHFRSDSWVWIRVKELQGKADNEYSSGYGEY